VKRAIIGFAAVALLAAIAVPGLASVQAGNNFIINYPITDAEISPYSLPHGSEGPFYMTANGGKPAATDSFLTLCVEQQEFYSPGSTYNVGGITFASVKTGRYLSPYDAWLYTNFRANTMPTAWLNLEANEATRVTAYNMLQYAIWCGMTSTLYGAVGVDGDEQTFGVYNSYMLTSYTAEALDTAGIGPTSFGNSGWGIKFGYVRVLNMYDLGGGNAQDQLGFIPEPMSLIVWSVLGLCGCIAVYRRQKRVA